MPDLDPKKIVSDIIERRNESADWLRKDVWPEWVEVWRSIKCRTKPIFKLDEAGEPTKIEDLSRTNVDMGLGNLVYRKNVARLSARPYTLRVIGGTDPSLGPRLSAKLSHDYDRSQEGIQDTRVRMSAEAFGIGISKVYWDHVVREMVFRKALMRGQKVVYRDRAAIMQHQGAPQDEISQAILPPEQGGLGPEMGDSEIAQFLGKSGDEINVPTMVPKYEGPCVKYVFPGDIYYQRGVNLISQSDFIGESHTWTDLDLKRLGKLKYCDPDTGEEKPVLDPDSVTKLLALTPKSKRGYQTGSQDLRDMLRAVEGKQSEDASKTPASLRIRKHYNIIQEHSQDENGRLWITYVSDGDYTEKPIGRWPYPCDTYGSWLYKAEVPLPDLIDAIGDSTPRLMRYLLTMYNLQVAQNFDGVTQSMRQIVIGRTGSNLSPNIAHIGNVDFYQADDPGAFRVDITPRGLPAGAMERGANLLQLLFMFEPALSGINSGSDSNPLAGKTATTSILAAKAADVLLQFKVDGRNYYLWDLGMTKLNMYQSMAESKWSDGQYAWQVGSKFFGPELQQLLELQQGQQPEWAMTGAGDKTTAISLDPMEMQEDLEVEPESGSYMAIDDQLRQDAAMRLGQIAMQAPNIVNARKVTEFAVSTVPGTGNPSEWLMPDVPPTPVPPKVNVNFAGKMEDFPEVAKAVLGTYGIETPSVPEVATANSTRRLSEMGDHADNLLGPTEERKQDTAAERAVENKVNSKD